METETEADTCMKARRREIFKKLGSGYVLEEYIHMYIYIYIKI